ncbi:uncharacterized protein [Diabrotica undecimpunctata]|uniref:uncharacterized protein n=1 Tax=Diabrotica undecimpunctata TaxID=50387 RepID=UPI003B6338DE
MNERPSKIPFSIIRELRCRNCQNIISCGPVHVLPDENVLCGRCKQYAKEIYRNYPFEALASMFFYPCRNWDGRCPRILRWNECMIHEDGCSYESGCSRFWKHPKAFLKGKRDMPYGDIRLVAIPEKLLDFIKCVQCESYLSCEPVYIRSDGKNICHRCIHSNGVPPDCIRNLGYEILSSIIIFPCVFRNRGCPTRLKFGTDLWHHEAECSYNQMFKKKMPEMEMGVFKSNVYGELSDFELKKKLVQSLKNKQEKKLKKAEEIEAAITRMSSEDGSDRDSDKANSYNKHLSEGSSSPSPTRLEDRDQKLLTPSNGDFKPASPISPVFVNSPEDFLHFNYNNIRPNSENYHQNINFAQIHYSHQNSNVSNQNTHYKNEHTADNEYMRNVSENNHFNQHGYYDAPLRSPSILKTPLQELDFNPMDGQSPIYVNPYGQGLIPKPSFKGVVRTDSLSSNRELIHELRVRQSRFKKSNEKKDAESPYKECQNLEEIIQVHKKIDQ